MKNSTLIDQEYGRFKRALESVKKPKSTAARRFEDFHIFGRSSTLEEICPHDERKYWELMTIEIDSSVGLIFYSSTHEWPMPLA